LELVDYTRRYQKPVGIPGTAFNYSDTGYILLGLLIEKITGKPFHQNLHDEIFTPLQMDNSYLMFYSRPRNRASFSIEKIWLKGKEVSTYPSMSADWAGGGIVSTCADLQIFHRALQEGRIIQSSTLQRMQKCHHKFRPGIHYGLGMMEIHFEEFFFLLRNLPRLTGHIGILGTHMFHDPELNAYITMNFVSDAKMVDSFRALIDIETRLHRIKA
jgi:D-alanyl-D-alanine carboxypeptidase